jgi:uncharacterized membrane protein YphA (DoxX/SURF4 family)
MELPMSSTTMSTNSASVKTIAFWVLKIVLALMFLAAAGAKIAGAPMMVAEFGKVGLGQWFRYFTALMEILGAILLFLPGRTAIGAGILACVCIGAFFAQLLAIHMDVVHTIVLAAIFLAIVWFNRRQLPGLR